MSDTNYNPFTPSGRYQLENYLYTNKRQVLAITGLLFALVMILGMWSLFSTKKRKTLNVYDMYN